ncbi:FAD-dependent oxidoreductase [Ideonella paludis]
MPDPGPRAALVDLGQQVSISRLGDRIRVSGGLRRGGQLKHAEARELKRLYRVLDLWFEGVARTSKAQEWHGARPCLPDSLPVIGPSAKPGIWLNLGHGNLGWTLGLGGAKMLAAQISGHSVGPEAAAFSTDRFR